MKDVSLDSSVNCLHYSHLQLTLLSNSTRVKTTSATVRHRLVSNLYRQCTSGLSTHVSWTRFVTMSSIALLILQPEKDTLITGSSKMSSEYSKCLDSSLKNTRVRKYLCKHLRIVMVKKVLKIHYSSNYTNQHVRSLCRA